MTIIDQDTYQPRTGDIRIQEEHTAHFYVHRYDGRAWHHLGWSDEPELVQHLVAPPFQCVAESECKGKKRLYYRWQG